MGVFNLHWGRIDKTLKDFLLTEHGLSEANAKVNKV